MKALGAHAMGFEFELNLREEDQTDAHGRKLGDGDMEAADLAWRTTKVFCFPRDQPKGAEQAFTLTVKSDDGTQGRSAEFYIEKEMTMNGEPDGNFEINAALVHKLWDLSAGAHRAPQSDHPLSLHSSGGSVNIYNHPSDLAQVLRELKEFPSSVLGRREFLKDLSVWQLVGTASGGKVPSISGWFFDAKANRAGFCMPHFARSLDDNLSHDMLMRERFEKCDQVLQIMMALQREFPFLMFPDIKPRNFLCDSQSGHASHADKVMLTDLDDVRRVGSVVPTHTSIYSHPDWTNGVPTSKLFEQHAVVVTLLQILLGMKSQVPPTLCASVPALVAPPACPSPLRLLVQHLPRVSQGMVNMKSPTVAANEVALEAVAGFSNQGDMDLKTVRQHAPAVIAQIKSFFNGNAHQPLEDMRRQKAPKQGYLRVQPSEMVVAQSSGSREEDVPLYSAMHKEVADLGKGALEITQVHLLAWYFRPRDPCLLLRSRLGSLRPPRRKTASTSTGSSCGRARGRMRSSPRSLGGRNSWTTAT